MPVETTKVRIVVPTLHLGQVAAYDSFTRFTALRCGRRFGKTELLGILACDAACKGYPVGYFAPDYKRLSAFYRWCEHALAEVKIRSSQMAGIIRVHAQGGGEGEIEFWTLNDPQAGRSRKYKMALIDEAAFAGPDMMEIWRASIKPTLLDYTGTAVVASNTNGIDSEQFFWQICNEKRHRFGPVCEDGTFGFHATSFDNPYMPREELEDLRRNEHPLVFKQEYLAEFVDWSGVAFFSLDKLLVGGRPVGPPRHSAAVFATIDTATKTGRDCDGTAVIYWAIEHLGLDYKLVLLDWDITQIEGALLETWLPTIHQNLESLAKECSARGGSLGSFIEDKSSGMVLIQQAKRRGLPVTAIESKLTSVGKDERAISVSGYHYRGMVKISQHAYDKVIQYKGTSRNHLRAQVTGFRIGDKDGAKRADDLLDCYTYGLAIGLGDSGGF